MPTLDGFLTAAQLGMFPVAVFLTYVVVAYTKGTARRVPAAPSTQAYAWGVAFVVVLAGQLVNGASYRDPSLYLLAAANALVVGLASGKMHDMAQAAGIALPATLETTQPPELAPSAPADSAPNEPAALDPPAAS